MNNTIGKNIARLRKENGMPQEALSRLTSYSKSRLMVTSLPSSESI